MNVIKLIFVAGMVFLVIACGGGAGGRETPELGQVPNPPSVEDQVPPIVTLNGAQEQSMGQYAGYTELGAEAVDDVDGNIAVQITGRVDTDTPGSYVLNYSATDNAGNSASVERRVNVLAADTTPPQIKLNGEALMTFSYGALFVDPGASALDETDGVLAVAVSGQVEQQSLGTYVLTYSASDSAGNTASVQRTVTIQPTGQVETYGAPGEADGVLASEKYRVRVMQDGLEYESYVNVSINNHTKNVGSGVPEVLLTDSERENKFRTDSNHWSSFSFDGEITVEIDVPEYTQLTDVELRPIRLNLAPEIDGSVLRFRLESPANIYVKIGGEARDPLFIFANPLPEVRPNLNDPQVYRGEDILANPALLDAGIQQTIYFGPGVHVVSEPVLDANGLILSGASDAARFPLLPSNTKVYIDGGAYVKGLFRVDDQVENVHFVGRGIISGWDYPHQSGTWANHLIEFEGFGQRSSNIGVAGLTMVDMPKTCLIARSGPIVIDNIKCLSWHANSDGIASGPGSMITNSFFKVFDDVIKLFHSNIVVDTSVIWHQQTGSAFQLSWNLSQNVSDVSVTNIDIIAVDRYLGTVYQTGGSASDYPNGSRSNGAINNALINARNLKGATLSNLRFENVYFDVQPFQLVQLQLKDFRPGFNSGFGDIHSLYLDGVYMPEIPRVESYILDNGAGTIQNVFFEHIHINGEVIEHDVVEEISEPQ